MLVERSIDADTSVSVLERLVAKCGAAEYPAGRQPRLGADPPRPTGPVLVFNGRDRVHRSSRAAAEPFVESFHSCVRDALLEAEECFCLAQAKVL